MTFTRSVSLGKLCAIACLAFLCGASAQAAELPWYKRILRRNPVQKSSHVQAPAPSKEIVRAAQPQPPASAPKPAAKPIQAYKQDRSAHEVDDSLPEFRDDEESYRGPDLSEERTTADEVTKREFPMPQARFPDAPPVPPSPDRYKLPVGSDTPARAVEKDRR